MKPFFSLYYICINGIIEKSGSEVLELLNITSDLTKDYNTIEDRDFDVLIARNSHWTYIMDGCLSTLYHSNDLTKRIVSLGEHYEIFTCSVGDCDLSFDFKYFTKGKLVRDYVVKSPNFKDEVIHTNIGIPLPGEFEGLRKIDQLEKVGYIANSIGVVLPTDIKGIKTYNFKSIN